MQRFKTYTLTALGILALSGALSLTGISQTMAAAVMKGVQKVSITNSSIGVKGSVEVSNTPSVKLDPAGNMVETAPSKPIQFQATVNVGYDAKHTPVTSTAYTVPAGERLVIEYVAVDFVEAYQNDETILASFRTGAASSPGPRFFIPLTYEGTTDSFHLVGAQQTRVYANPGDVVTAEAAPLDVIQNTSATFSFSGYLVNAS